MPLVPEVGQADVFLKFQVSSVQLEFGWRRRWKAPVVGCQERRARSDAPYRPRAGDDALGNCGVRFQSVKSDISGVLCGVFSVQPGPRMGLIEEETGGGSGYDHPSPSIPLPVEGRGKPVATLPGILGALAASVTDLQTGACITCFLSEALGWRRLAKACPLGCQ